MQKLWGHLRGHVRNSFVYKLYKSCGYRRISIPLALTIPLFSRGLACLSTPKNTINQYVINARLGVMQALSRHVERVFDPSREAMKWGRRKLARDQ